MNLAVIGLQFGDEGKGKIVDYLAKDFDIVARFSGGSNAGHTVVFDRKKIRFHLLPSGVLRGKTGLLGNGMVINLVKLKEEVEKIRELGIKEKILISSRAHVVTKFHEIIDSQEDKIIGIGTTKQGIGPAYESKTRRIGIRMVDVFNREIMEKKIKLLLKFSGIEIDENEIKKEIKRSREIAYEFRDCVVDTDVWLNRAIDSRQNVLFEGSQGTFLDIDFGFYPYVTSTHTTVGGIITGLGIPPTKIHRVLGVTKAYTTRVGGGPFPTEIYDEEARRIREKGKEYGATTGRERRIGYLDLVLLRYSTLINGVNSLAITKVDVVSNMEKIPIAIRYKCGEKEYEYPPPNVDNCKPIYEYIDGWSGEDSSSYIRFSNLIGEKLGRKIEIISFGEDREKTIKL